MDCPAAAPRRVRHAVSYFHDIRMFTTFSYTGDFSDFVKMFVNGQLLYGPWWSHVDEYSNAANVHIVYYEDLQEVRLPALSFVVDLLPKKHVNFNSRGHWR